MIGYELKNNKWTPKATKKTIEESTSKEKAPSGSVSSMKSLAPEFEGTESILDQMMELLQNLNKKVDNVATRLLLVERKVQELKKEMNLMRMEKQDEDESEEDEDNKEEKEDEE